MTLKKNICGHSRRSSLFSGLAATFIAALLAVTPCAAQVAGNIPGSPGCRELVDPEFFYPFLVNSSGEAALDLCRQEQQSDPGNTDLMVRYGLSQYAARQFGPAADLMARAAALGNPHANHHLAIMLFYGDGVPKDVTRSREHFEVAAEGGIGRSASNLAMGMIFDWFGQGPNVSEGMKVLNELAEKGELHAMDQLGRIYLYGYTGGEIELEKGLEFTRRAAEAGYPPAMSHYGAIYMIGKAVGRDYGESFRWLSKSAPFGEGQYDLAWLHATGSGTSTNPTEAAIWILADVLAKDSVFPKPDFTTADQAPTANIATFLRVNGFYKGWSGKMSPQLISALHRFRQEAYRPAFPEMVDLFREDRKRDAERFVNAMEKALDARSAERRVQEGSNAEKVVIDHPPAKDLSPEWRNFLRTVRLPNKDKELNGFRAGSIGEIDQVWVHVLAVDPDSSTVYYTRPFSDPLLSNDVRYLDQPDLASIGDHSGTSETLLLDKPWHEGDPDWKRWYANLSYAFGSESFNGIKTGDKAYLTGLIGDAPILILAFDEKRSQFYYIRESNLFLYRIGSDHVVSASDSRMRGVARGAAALGLAYCAMSGKCAN